ncbi:MAG: beta-ketoacyl-[acyl-carrier-protein] synthase family protein [Desulfovibrionales bacterium]|nr:beta-ketoacyl-[acyl-carrier-protein] synthase family protein [Desulfovibrionales bacterium]
MSSCRVVLTGCGFELPVGRTEAEVHAALRQAHGPFVSASEDACIAVCPVPGFDLKQVTGRLKNARYLSRGQQLAVAAAKRAVENAGLHAADMQQAGIFLGLGPNLEASPGTAKALWLLDYLPNTAVAVIAELLDLHGENLTIMTACAASTQAIGQAMHAVARGDLKVALAGGGDSRLSGPGLAAYAQAGVLSRTHTRPEQACRPFDVQRSGFAIGEGGAVLVLENLDHARARGATILGEVVGAASSLDGASLTGPDPTGRAASRAVQACLHGLQAQHICVLAHGTGTALNDAMESLVIQRIGEQVAAVAAFKSWIGHLAAACGAAELILGLLCARNGLFPPIAHLEQPCAPGLPFLQRPTILHPDMLLVHSFGFGGQNACLGVRPWSEKH